MWQWPNQRELGLFQLFWCHRLWMCVFCPTCLTLGFSLTMLFPFPLVIPSFVFAFFHLVFFKHLFVFVFSCSFCLLPILSPMSESVLFYLHPLPITLSLSFFFLFRYNFLSLSLSCCPFHPHVLPPLHMYDFRSVTQLNLAEFQSFGWWKKHQVVTVSRDFKVFLSV